MAQKDRTMYDLILEDVARNPILTDEELAEMLEPLSEEEIREEERMTEEICRKIELHIEKYGTVPSNSQLKQIEEDCRRERMEH